MRVREVEVAMLNRTKTLKEVVMTAHRLSVDMTAARRASVFIQTLQYAQEDTGEDFSGIIEVLQQHHNSITLRTIIACENVEAVLEKLRRWINSSPEYNRTIDQHLYIPIHDIRKFVASHGMKFELLFDRLKNEAEMYNYQDRERPRYSRHLRVDGEKQLFYGFSLKWLQEDESL